MKTVYLIIVFLTIFSCNSKDSYYAGYIYNHENKPIENVKIYQMDSIKNFTFTNSKGSFYLKRDKNWVSDLVINYDNKLDTIRTIGKQGGEKINYFFIDSIKDTIFLKTKE